jgi:kinetochore protein Nuf2
LVIQDVRGCIEQLIEIERESAALAAAEKALQDLYDKRDKASVHKNALLLEAETVTLQLESAEERLERMQRHQQDRQAAVAQMLERLRAENAQLVIERRENDKEVAQLRGEADTIEHRMQVRQDKEQEEMNDVYAVYWDLRQQTGISAIFAS